MPNHFLSAARPELQDFILAHENEDERAFVLKQDSIQGVPSSVIAAQLAGRRKAKTRMETFYRRAGIVYPPSINLEQCSSEATARLKAKILSKGSDQIPRGADLTGGFGVDAYFISQECSSLDYVEHDPDLLAIARHNHTVLNARGIRYHSISAEEFLKTPGLSLDFLYIDPSRRSYSKKVFHLAQCQPNVIDLLPIMRLIAKRILIKASPLLDLHQAIVELKTVESIFVVAVEHECKEVLLLCSTQSVNNPIVRAINFSSYLDIEPEGEFTFTFDEEHVARSAIHDPLTYLYEPHSWVLKTGAFKTIGVRYGLSKLHANTHLYTSNELINDFPGRVFRIEDHGLGTKNSKKILPEGRASIFVRNYPLTPEGLRKKLRLQEGGEKYVIGFSGAKQKFLVVATRIK